ncbi:MAG: hypothetical protein R2747_06285 [Pyrinomonadaceae bacterium]
MNERKVPIHSPFLATRFRLIAFIFIFLMAPVISAAQTEILRNNEIILLSRAGLSAELIIRKIRDSACEFDTSTEALIDLKKSGVADEVISLMLEKTAEARIPDPPESKNESSENSQGYSDSVPVSKSYSSDPAIDPKEALRSARTIAIEKSSIHPSRQALEKELLKRPEWKNLHLNIVRYKEGADLYIEIGYVPLSWITHRYAWRVFDNRSGTVIVAGETTSWGSLAKNLAREITKKMDKFL